MKTNTGLAGERWRPVSQAAGGAPEGRVGRHCRNSFRREIADLCHQHLTGFSPAGMLQDLRNSP